MVVVVLGLLAFSSAFAGGFEFRSDGYFTSSDGSLKLAWDGAVRRCVLSTQGNKLLDFTGPATIDGKVSPWYASEPRVSVDKDAKKVVIEADMPGGNGVCTMTLSEQDNGVLIEYANSVDGSNISNARVLFPVELFAGKKVVWKTGELIFPAEYVDGKAGFFSDWQDTFFPLKIVLSDSQAIALSSPASFKDVTFSDCRAWTEKNYHLSLNMKGGKSSLLLQLAPVGDEAATGAAGGEKKNLLNEGASFEAGPDGIELSNRYSWNEKMTTMGRRPEFDETSAVHGKRSLKLVSEMPQKHDGRFAFVGTIFKRTLLERGKKYTLSAWLKADRPGMRAGLYCGEDSWSGGGWDPVEITTEWKRYSHEFSIDNFEKSGYCLSWISVPQNQEGTVWVDAVQLEEGDLSDFMPSTPVEVGLEVTKEFKLFEPGQSCEATLRLRNNKDKPFAEDASYTVIDYWGKEVKKGELAVKCDAGANAEAVISVGELPLGYYRIYCTVAGEKEEAIFGVYRPQEIAALPEDWPLACHNDPMPIVRKIGFGMLRAFDIFQFSKIAPSADKFDFSESDRYVERMEKNGLSVMPILSGFGWPHWRPDPPVAPYAQREVEERMFGGRKDRMAWPTIEAWKRYVGGVVGHYKGRIKYWEVYNEPNLSMYAEEYYPYLKAAYEAAKEADPDCKIIGLCATSDFQGRPDSYSRQVFKLGGTNYFDLCSVHMYLRSPEQSLGIGSDKALEGWREMLKSEYNKTSDIWHTEKSYISSEVGYSARKVPSPLEYCDEPQFFIQSMNDKANWMIRETILSAIGGHGKFFWFGGFYDERFIAHRIFQPYVLDHTEYDDSPMPELIGANGLAWAMLGMNSPVSQMAWGETARCAIFTGPEGTMAVLWRTEGDVKAHMPRPGTKVEGLDFFGNKLPLGESGDIKVTIGESPVYLRFSGIDANKCIALMNTMTLESSEPLKQVGYMVSADGAPAWKLTFTNPQLSALDADITIECPAGWTAKQSKVSLKGIMPGMVAQAIIPLSEVPAKSAGATFTFKTVINGQEQAAQFKSLPFTSKEQLMGYLAMQDSAVASHVTTAPTIDGDLADWSDDGAVSISTDDYIKEKDGAIAWKGPYDSSVILRLRWDEKNLYIAARVFDDFPIQPQSAKTSYSEDCLEVFLSPDGKTVCQGLFFPIKNSSGADYKAWWMHKSSEMDSKVACRILPDGYALEIAVPWSGLDFTPKSGQTVPFSFSLDDTDQSGDKRKSVLIWKGDTANFQSTQNWGRLQLK